MESAIKLETISLSGKHVKLEPLGLSHVAGLVKAAADNPALFKWTFVPQGMAAMTRYIETALAGLSDNIMLPFAIVDSRDGKVLGSTRYWNVQYWAWPDGHERFGRSTPDVCEIGHTWLTASATNTAVNTECKLLLLTHAFENWDALRVCFQTDVRNERSRAAIERIGGKFEGIVRAERLAADNTVRDTARFSIIKAEWPQVKEKLVSRLG
jgi:N-acetyltransferase